MARRAVLFANFKGDSPLFAQRPPAVANRMLGVVNVRRLGGDAIQFQNFERLAGDEAVEVGRADVVAAEVEAVEPSTDAINATLKLGRQTVDAVEKDRPTAVSAQLNQCVPLANGGDLFESPGVALEVVIGDGDGTIVGEDQALDRRLPSPTISGIRFSVIEKMLPRLSPGRRM